MDDNGKLPNHLTYKIRQNATISQTTKLIKDILWEPFDNHKSDIYFYNGFVILQDLIERSVIALHTNSSVPIVEPGTYVQKFPTPCHMNDR